tara:strand:+ start:327 stop:503 length:177 start_codon:yes stop_codon:yes gene_type:complete
MWYRDKMNNIITFPIQRQMDKIVRESIQVEKKSRKILINAYKKVYGDRWKDYYRKHYR